MENKRNEVYLLTGAAGFLGSTICRQLVEEGKKVVAFVLPGDKAARFIPLGVRQVEGDLCNEEDVERFFNVENAADIFVIHCASVVTVKPDHNPLVMKVNVNGTKNIIRACRLSRRFKKLVYVGSTGAIPTLPKGQFHREIARFDPELVPDCYSKSKAIASNMVLDAAADGLDACIVMPTGILGPYDNSISTTTGTVIRILKGEMSMGINGSFNLADVRDLAAGTISAIEKGRRGESYILGNKVVSFKDFARLIADASDSPRMKFFLPCSIARRLAAIMEKKARKKGTEPLLTTYSVDVLAKNNEYDSSKAMKELGYSCRSYKETMNDEVGWLKASRLIG